MALWVGAQGQVKVAKNTPTCGVPLLGCERVTRLDFWLPDGIG